MHLSNHTALPFRRQVTYKGVRPNDQVIWEQFILRWPDSFDAVWYDVVIGDPTRHGDDEAAMRANGAYQVMQWRVDVIAKKGDDWYIIELKPNALAGALGQVLAYKALLVQEGRVPENTKCMVLTDNLSPITERASELLGVAVIVP